MTNLRRLHKANNTKFAQLNQKRVEERNIEIERERKYKTTERMRCPKIIIIIIFFTDSVTYNWRRRVAHSNRVLLDFSAQIGEIRDNRNENKRI